ncbi:MAG: Hpt domain-containing protein [Pseudomonadota bacterium]
MAVQDVLDVSQLDVATGGDAALTREVLGIFRHQAEIWGRMLDPHEDARVWADACHTVKGAARSIGATALGDACEAGETRGRDGDVTVAEASVLLATVKEKIAEALEAIAHLDHQLALSEDLSASNASNS